MNWYYITHITITVISFLEQEYNDSVVAMRYSIASWLLIQLKVYVV